MPDQAIAASEDITALHALALEELAEMYASASEDMCAAILAECERRDRADARAERQRLRAFHADSEWREIAHGDYLAAEAACRGSLLSRVGQAADVDPWSLWSGPASRAYRYASEELRTWWETHPRMTVTAWRQQQATARRIDRDQRDLEALLAAEPEQPDSTEVAAQGTETDGSMPDDSTDTAELAADVPGGLRLAPDGQGSQAPQRGPVAAVLHGNPDSPAQARTGACGAARAGAAVRRRGHAVTTSYAAIAPQATHWLWEGRIPLGEVTLIVGEGGVSKGLTLIDLAARVTTGRPMPGSDEGGEPGSVILITPEDDLQETVAWRLRAAGADLSRVHDMTYLDGGSPFQLSADLIHPGNPGQLRAAIDEIGDVRLVVVDPMMATVAYGTVATNLGARRVVAPLQRIAKETGVAIVMSHHTVKSGSIAGSKGLIDALRVVYRICRDPENPAHRVMSLEKANVLGETEDLRYTLDGEGHDVRVRWLRREDLERQRTAWRERLAARASARVPATGTPQQARAVGCDHAYSRWGTARQCGTCPAGDLAQPPAKAPSRPVRPAQRRPWWKPAPAPVAPAASGAGPYAAVCVPAGAGATSQLGSYSGLEAAMAACQAHPSVGGHKLAWIQQTSGTWTGRGRGVTFAISASGTR